MRHWLSSALWFCAPFTILLVLWAVLVPYFDVNPRLSPPLTSVVQAGSEGIQDGTLIQHIGASLLRVAVGTVLALSKKRTPKKPATPWSRSSDTPSPNWLVKMSAPVTGMFRQTADAI